jgi:pimeloyl-ACP methyl ester carboxylesterase
MTIDMQHGNVALGDTDLHVVQAGPAHSLNFVFLHGWPESWRTWRSLMEIAAPTHHVVAVDLPGIGASMGGAIPSSKSEIAAMIHALIAALELDEGEVTLVGHDIGGMVVYAYLRQFSGLHSAVIMDVPIPGVDPWDEFIRQPFLWHFALHAVAELPESLVTGRVKEYFAYFYDLLSASPGLPTEASRAEQTAAYESRLALTSGFNWYRSFATDVEDNRSATAGPPTVTPLLYVRGEKERGGALESYVEGLRRSGVTNVQSALIPGAGHFPQEENTQEIWRLLQEFTTGR